MWSLARAVAASVARGAVVVRAGAPAPASQQSNVCVSFGCVLRALYATSTSASSSLLSTLAPRPGATHSEKRVGRGRGSRLGKTSGRGSKGQHARSKVHPRFEGGQTPLYKRVPKWGMTNASFKLELEELNLDRLRYLVHRGRLDASQPITMRELVESGGVTRVRGDGVKLLARGASTFDVAVNIEVTRASAAAIEAVERAGGSITCKYYNRLNLRQLIKPHKFAIPVAHARPRNIKLLKYYRDPEHRGYLASEGSAGTAAVVQASSS